MEEYMSEEIPGKKMEGKKEEADKKFRKTLSETGILFTRRLFYYTLSPQMQKDIHEQKRKGKKRKGKERITKPLS